MKIFANKNIWKKIILIFLLILSLSFVTPNPVKAASIGGELMEPICNFLVGLGDSVIGVLHRALINQELSLIKIDFDVGWVGIVKTLAIAAAVVAVLAVVIGATGGLGAILGGVSFGEALLQGIGSVLVLSSVSGFFVGAKVADWDFWDNQVALPLYSISPAEIFKNDEKLPIFDVNFFEPKTGSIKYRWNIAEVSDKIRDDSDYKNIYGPSLPNADIDSILKDNIGVKSYQDFIKEAIDDNSSTLDGTITRIYYYQKEDIVYRLKCEYKNNSVIYTLDSKKGNIYLENEGEIHALSYELKQIISVMYNAIRIIATVGMMTVLVYIGIRILISSTSPQKAKYKQLLIDWFIGMVLLFTMHFIMIFSNKAVAVVSKFLGNINQNVFVEMIPSTNSDTDGINIDRGIIKQELEAKGIKVNPYEEGKDSEESISSTEKIVYEYKNGNNKYILWPTNLMGMIRMELQNSSNENADKYLGYTIMFLVMVFYTILFAWTYIKRVIYMAFLTIIAPLVALTYPIDKANDGSAQGFNYWFKEYIFNLLLQPVHLLIYTILVSMAVKLAMTNWIYSLVALGFIATAEKIVRQMFNFSKASTPGVLGGATGAALTMSGMRWLLGHGPRGGEKGGTNKGGSGDDKASEGVTSGKTKTTNQELLSDIAMANSVSEGTTDTVTNSTVVTPSAVGNEPQVSQDRQDGENVSINTVAEAPEIPENADDVQTFDIPLIDDYDPDQSLEEMSDDNYIRHIGDLAYEEATGERSGNRYRNVQDQLKYTTDPKKKKELLEDFKEKEISRDRKRRAYADAKGAYFDGLSKKFKRSLKNAQPARTLGRLATGAMFGATLGTIGLAAGVAEGNFGHAVKHTVEGAAIGNKLGRSAYNSASNALQVDGVGEAYERARLGEKEYIRKQAEKNQKRKAEDEATIRRIQEKMNYSRKEAKEKAQEWAKAYMDEGVNNVDDWIYIEKMIKNKNLQVKDKNGTTRNYSRNEAIAAHKLYNRYDISHNAGKEKEVLERIAKDYTNGNVTAAQIYFKAAKDYDNIRNG